MKIRITAGLGHSSIATKDKTEYTPPPPKAVARGGFHGSEEPPQT